MGAEFPMDLPVEGQRKEKRARVLLAAKIKTSGGVIEGRLRDLSRKGALVECTDVPAPGTEVIFTRGTTSVPARVAWAGRNRVGLEFLEMIEESEVLVQLGRPGSQVQQRFRRPRLHGEDLPEDARKLAEKWGLAVGIAISGD